MKKNKFLFGVFVLTAVLFAGCDFLNFADSDDYEEDIEKTLEEKYNIETHALSGSSSDDVYMIVYNTGESTINSSDYQYTGPVLPEYTKSSSSSESRSADGIQHAVTQIVDSVSFMDDDYSHYNCGLSKMALWNEIDLRPETSHARAGTTTSKYDKTKYQKAADLWDEEDFYITDDDNYQHKIKAKCVYYNDIVQIFVECAQYATLTSTYTVTENSFYDDSNTSDYCTGDKNTSFKVTNAGVKAIADKFAEMYYPIQVMSGSSSLKGFNSLSYIIANPEKITILITDLGAEIKPTSNGGESVLATLGYFAPMDLYCNVNTLGQIETSPGKPQISTITKQPLYSNQRQMFTVNTVSYSKYFGAEDLFSTLAHEYNHMINYIYKVLGYGTKYDTWFTEMLSLTTEDYVSGILNIYNTVQDRLSYFMKGTSQGMINWDGNEDVLYSYAYAYAFGAFLLRNYGGPNDGTDLLLEMATNDKYGKDAISAALEELGYTNAKGNAKTYDDVLLEFAFTLLNADGNDDRLPTLNNYVGDITYIEEINNVVDFNFNPIDLYEFSVGKPDTEYYCNPEWGSPDKYGYYYGPVFLKRGCCPENIYGDAFYITYLGKIKDLYQSKTSDGEYEFYIPTDENIKVAVYIK